MVLSNENNMKDLLEVKHYRVCSRPVLASASPHHSSWEQHFSHTTFLKAGSNDLSHKPSWLELGIIAELIVCSYYFSNDPLTPLASNKQWRISQLGERNGNSFEPGH